MGTHWQKTALVIVLSVLLAGIVVSGRVPSSSSQTTKTHIYTDGKIIVRGSGEPVELINNPDATNPTFAELVAFLEIDRTDEYPYIVGPPKNAFVCSDFAETVHNNAEAAGIRAAWVGINIEGETEGHALNAFETTDLGLVYIDCTGKGLWDEDNPRLRQGDRRALVEIGEPYALAGMNSPASHFWFYISSAPMRNSLGLTYPNIWELFRGGFSEAGLEWHRTHDIIALGQKWMQEWLQKHEAELSECGRVNEPFRSGSEWYVYLPDCWDVPWFQEQVLVKEGKGAEYWLGFREFTLLNQYDKVEQQIIEVDGLPIAWEIGWSDGVRHWSSGWFKPYEILNEKGVVSRGAVKDIHIHW